MLGLVGFRIRVRVLPAGKMAIIMFSLLLPNCCGLNPNCSCRNPNSDPKALPIAAWRNPNSEPKVLPVAATNSGDIIGNSYINRLHYIYGNLNANEVRVSVRGIGE